MNVYCLAKRAWSVLIVLVLFTNPFTAQCQSMRAEEHVLAQRHASSVLVYTLDSSQYLRLYYTNKLDDSLGLFTRPYATFPWHDPENYNTFPPGHYLAIKVSENSIEYVKISNSFFKLQTFGYNGEAWNILTDRKGELITGAVLAINGKEYPFRDDCACYPVPAKESNGLMKITYKDYYDFYIVQAAVPANQKYSTETQQQLNQNSSANVRILPGYVAFNKPKYRLLDTVKVKAFLVKGNGSPWKKKVSLFYYNQYATYNQTWLGTIKRTSKGAYTHEFVLPDSLVIGQYYGLDFKNKKGRYC